MPIDWDKAVIGPLNAVFGEPVAYTTAAGASVTGISGVFDAAYSDINLSDPLGTTTIKPVLGVQLSQFLALPAQDDLVQIPSVNNTYVVREVRLDGHGWAKLMLGFKSSS